MTPPAARRHTRWSRSKPTRDFLLGAAMIAAAAWGWSAWRADQRAACAAAEARGTVETVAEAGAWTYLVAFKGGPAARLEVGPGGLVPRPGCRGRVCERGHWHVETPEGDF